MGGDGSGLPANSAMARDVFGFGLHYYDSGTELDYKAIGGGTSSFARPNNGANFKSLYTGNIAAMTVNNSGLTKGAAGTTNALPLMYNYQYDQLNRIVAMRAYQGLNEATNTWTPVAIDDYQEAVSYDANGNIKSYVRNGAPSIAGKQTLMDNLGYNYDAGTNQLNHVTDNVNAANYTEDIDGQDVNNYRYDAIGNLVKDVSEGITDINWTVYGKIASITKASGNISYTYDAAGNRVTKTASGKTTLYVRDGSGNVMSVYEIPTANTINQKELHLYGSSRIGIALPESQVLDNSTTLESGFGNATLRSLVRAEKIFELSNHLGNVLVTISDKKISIPKASPNQAQIDHYEADVVTATDYAPFGMQLVGRNYSASNNRYRYGFNGKENDNEVKGEGNQQDYGMRIYDNRLGRFLSVDPIANDFPWNSAYSYAEGDPINYIDLDGLEKPDQTAQTATTVPGMVVTTKVTTTTIEKGTKLAVNGSGKLVPQNAGWKWFGRLASRTAGVFGFILTPLDAGTSAPPNIPDGYVWGGDQVILKPGYQRDPNNVFGPALPIEQPKADLKPLPKTEYDPKVKPPKEGDEDGFYIYETERDIKQSKGIVDKGKHLPYFGITGDAFIGGRYSPLSVEGANLKDIIGKTNYYTAKGVETALILLNTTDFSMVSQSTRVDNDRVSTVNPARQISGEIWLNINKPNWRTNYLRPKNPKTTTE